MADYLDENFVKIRYYICFITIELIQVKQLILRKVIEGKNAIFVTIAFLIMEANFKILCAMVVII